MSRDRRFTLEEELRDPSLTVERAKEILAIPFLDALVADLHLMRNMGDAIRRYIAFSKGPAAARMNTDPLLLPWIIRYEKFRPVFSVFDGTKDLHLVRPTHKSDDTSSVSAVHWVCLVCKKMITKDVLPTTPDIMRVLRVLSVHLQNEHKFGPNGFPPQA